MIFRGARLLAYLRDQKHVRVHLFLNEDSPEELSLAQSRVVWRNGLQHGSNWLSNEYWEANDFGTLDEASLPVFDAAYEELPPNCLSVLARCGIKMMICWQDSAWHCIEISRNLFQGVTRSIRGFVGNCKASLQRNFRKAYLKASAVDLHDAGVKDYRHNTGFCYVASIPAYLERADSPDIVRSSLLLFEESAELTGQESHDAIRSKGRGRYSHWGEDLYFSSTDGSDPNANGRRYRFIFVKEGKSLQRVALFLCGIGVSGARSILARSRDTIRGKELPPVFAACAETLSAELGSRMAADEARGYGGENRVSDEIHFLVGSLATGGSERQVCYLARGLKERGFTVRVLCLAKPTAHNLHYYPLLQAAGIPVHVIDGVHGRFNSREIAAREGGLETLEIINQLPSYLQEEVYHIYSHLCVFRPRVLHCVLDATNIMGGLGAWLAGTPKVILNIRSVNPTFFSYVYHEWYRPWYRAILASPRVTLIGNSHAGVESYAEWLGLPRRNYEVLHNALESSAAPENFDEQARLLRASLGVSQTDLVIAGVFRFTPEKRPFRLLRLVAELRSKFPNLHLFLAGAGPLKALMRREAHNLGLESVVHFLGLREDVPVVMRSADIVALVSSEEGLPNVLMEAQSLARPVIATAVGGTREAVQNGVSGFLCKKNDFAELLAATSELLQNRELRERMGREGRAWIREHFTIKHSVDEHLSLYELGNTAAALETPSVVNI